MGWFPVGANDFSLSWYSCDETVNIIGVVAATALYTAALITSNIVQSISNIHKAFSVITEYNKD